MDDDYDSEQDFVLPPLPTKPQKTLLSFFATKNQTKVKAKNIIQQNEEVQKPSKSSNRKRKNFKEPSNDSVTVDEAKSNKKNIESEITTNDSPLRPLQRRSRRSKKPISSNEEEEEDTDDSPMKPISKPNRRVKKQISSDEEDVEEENNDSPMKSVSKQSSTKKVISSDEEDLDVTTNNNEKEKIEEGKLNEEEDNEEDKEEEEIGSEKILENQNKKKTLHREILTTSSGMPIYRSEMVKCDIPTPFPIANHIQQKGENQTSMDLNPSGKDISFQILIDTDNHFIPQQCSTECWKSFLQLDTVKKTTIALDKSPLQKTVEEWLQHLEELHKDIPVRKIFQQYVFCQKKVVMSDLQKIQASKLAVESIWQKHSEIQNIEKKMTKTPEVTAEIKVEKKKEGKDIRKMFTNKKTKKSSSKVTRKTNTEKEKEMKITKKKQKNKKVKDQEVEKESAEGSKEELEEEEEEEVEEEEEDDEKDTSQGMSLSLKGLFGKALKKKHKKKNAGEEIESAEEEEEGILKDYHSDEEIQTKRESKDIRMLFQNVGKKLNLKDCSESTETSNNENRSQGSVDNLNNINATGDGEETKSLESRKKSEKEVSPNVENITEISTETKKKKKRMKNLDFLKIKLKPSADEKAQEEYNNGDDELQSEEMKKKPLAPNKNIKSMFAKLQNEQLLKIRRVELSVVKQTMVSEKEELDDFSTKLLMSNVNQSIEVTLEESVMVVDQNIEVTLEESVMIVDIKSEGDQKEAKESDCAMEIDTHKEQIKDDRSNELENTEILPKSLTTELDCELEKPSVKQKQKPDIRCFFGSRNKNIKSKQNNKREQVRGISKQFEEEKKDDEKRTTERENINKVKQAGIVKANVVLLSKLKEINPQLSIEIKTEDELQSILGEEDVEEKLSMKPENLVLNEEEDVKSERSDTNKNITTPCKIELQKIVSPKPCMVIAEDVSSLLQNPSMKKRNSKSQEYCVGRLFDFVHKTEETDVTGNQSQKKRKRNSSQSESNKKLKHNDGVEPVPLKRRSLRNRKKPEDHTDMTIIDDTVNIEPKTEENNKNKIKVKATEKESKVKKHDCEEEEKENIQSCDQRLRRSSRSRRNINYYEQEKNENTKELKENTKELKENTKELNENTKELKENASENKAEERKDNKAKYEMEEEIENVEEAEASIIEIGAKISEEMKTLMVPLTPKKIRPVIELILNEATINSFLSWTEKYKPIKARYVLGDKNTTKELFNWLCSWKEKHESIIKKMADRANRKSTKTCTSDSEFDSSDESDDEELLSNTLLLTGPTGCGTTAAIQACAKQMDFKILELNPSMYRTGKRIFDLVSEAVVSHQVQKGIMKQKMQSGGGHLSTFFKADKTHDDGEIENLKHDAMSLVLFEQSDLIYEELDKGFWQGVADLRKLSKRPIILTANDDKVLSYINIDEDIHTEHMSMCYPTTEQMLPIMQIMCLVEQIFVPSPLLKNMIEYCKNDVRQIMMQLHFWFDQGKIPLFTKLKNKKSCDSVNDTNQSKETHGNSKSVNIEKTGDSVMEVASEDKREIPLCNPDVSIVDVTSISLEHSVTHDTHVTQKDNKCTEALEIDRQKTSSNEPLEDLLIKETSSKCLPLFRDEKHFIDWEKVLHQKRLIRKLQYKHYSFTKPKKNFIDVSNPLTNIANCAEMLSEIDSRLMPGHTRLDKDYFVRSSMVDSLSQSYSLAMTRDNHYPTNEQCDCARDITEQCYEYFTEQKLGLDAVNQNRKSTFQELYREVHKRLPTSTYLDCTMTSQYVIPHLGNICKAEDIRRNTQQRRKQRRFLHYLDTIGICFDDNTIDKLSTQSFTNI